MNQFLEMGLEVTFDQVTSNVLADPICFTTGLDLVNPGPWVKILNFRLKWLDVWQCLFIGCRGLFCVA